MNYEMYKMFCLKCVPLETSSATLPIHICYIKNHVYLYHVKCWIHLYSKPKNDDALFESSVYSNLTFHKLFNCLMSFTDGRILFI